MFLVNIHDLCLSFFLINFLDLLYIVFLIVCCIFDVVQGLVNVVVFFSLLYT